MPDDASSPPSSDDGVTVSDDVASFSESLPASSRDETSLQAIPASSSDGSRASGVNTASSSSVSASSSADSAASGVDAASVGVTHELLKLFLSKRSSQDRIEQVVRARMPERTAEAAVRKLVSDVNYKVMNTTALPKSPDKMRAWLSRVTVNAVIDHLRKETKEKKKSRTWSGGDDLPVGRDVGEAGHDDSAVDHDDFKVGQDDLAVDDAVRQVGEDDLPVDEAIVEVEQDSALVETVDAMFDASVLSDWLKDTAKTKADRLTLEMIQFKAATGVTNTQLAAQFGMTEAAYDNRLLRFKAKWVPAWKKEKARRLKKLLLLGVLVLLLLGIALAWLYRAWPRPVPPSAPTTEPKTLPVPAESGSVEPVFEPAAPPLPLHGDGKTTRPAKSAARPEGDRPPLDK